MSVSLIVNGQTYQYPANRESPSWGEDATAWAEAVTEVLANTVGTGDIVLTAANIANNQAAPANVIALAFDTGAVRAAIVEYAVYRVTTGVGAQEAVEVGTMYLGYKSTAASWEIAVIGGAGAGTTFSITNTGQVQYVSTAFTGSSYNGNIKFRARAIPIS